MTSNKEIQRKRVMLYFINATNELINDEGISNITLRKVADKAGYNSATLYNYFENLEHLIFYAAMKNMKDYTLALNTYLEGTKNAMDKFFRIWECFCDYSFDDPEIYNIIFFPNLNKDMEHYLREYYRLFPDEIENSDENISTMLLKSDIYQRNKTTIINCVKEEFIESKDVDKLNEIIILIYEGMLRKILKNKISYDDARNNTMDYIKSIVKSFLIKDYEFYF